MKNIAFLGAAGEVTGSCFLLTAQDKSQVLVDFGMFQGSWETVSLNYQPLGFNPSSLKGVFLTHAHLDHCGRLPMLVYRGFVGKVYMTAPTFSLVEIILNDAAQVAQENITFAPLYTPDEVEKVLDMLEIVEYDKEFLVGGLQVVFRDAGHILGSASIEITDTKDQNRIVFSGDLGNSPEDIVKPTHYIDSADIVVMESTYGDKLHPTEDPTTILKEEINTIEKTGGILLIPAFSLERTQEILHKINHLKKDGKIRLDTPVFMDSPMGIRATVIFKEFKNFYNEELQQHRDDPFAFEGLVVTEDARSSKEIAKAMDPKVIIAGSGMLTGGRMVHHAALYLPRNTTRILFVGYQAEETLGRKILEGAKNVVIGDKRVKIQAHIREIKSLSAHADQEKLLLWLEHIKGVKKVFLVHGDTIQRQILAQKIKHSLGIKNVFLPQNGQEQNLELI